MMKQHINSSNFGGDFEREKRLVGMQFKKESQLPQLDTTKYEHPENGEITEYEREQISRRYYEQIRPYVLKIKKQAETLSKSDAQKYNKYKEKYHREVLDRLYEVDIQMEKNQEKRDEIVMAAEEVLKEMRDIANRLEKSPASEPKLGYESHPEPISTQELPQKSVPVSKPQQPSISELPLNSAPQQIPKPTTAQSARIASNSGLESEAQPKPISESGQEPDPDDQREGLTGDNREMARLIASNMYQYFDIPYEKTYRVLRKAFGNMAEGTDFGLYNINNIAAPNNPGWGWNMASRIWKLLKFDKQPFETPDDFDRVVSCLYLRTAKYAEEIIKTISKGSQNLGFSFEQRVDIDIEKDRSVILIISDILEKEGLDPSDQQCEQRIQQLWSEVRDRQEQSFTESEDVYNSGAEKGERKPIDILYVSSSSSLEETFLPKQDDLVQSMNKTRNGQLNGEKRGTIYMHEENFSRAIRHYQQIQKDYEMGGNKADRHLVVYVSVHSTSNGNEFGGVDKLLAYMNPKCTSLMYFSCEGGRQLQEANKENRGRNANQFAIVSSTVAPLHPEESMKTKIFDAYSIAMKGPQKGYQHADVNKDGQVTMGELRYWLDVSVRYHDPIAFDNSGNQIVSYNPENGQQETIG
ncbi:MAG: hypothetical protein WCX61_04395 [Candidatus Peribacteraceae bacterium]